MSTPEPIAPGTAQRALRNILLPLDGSELAEGALMPALDLAARHGASVHLAYVLELPVLLPGYPEPPPEAGSEDQEKQAADYLNGIEDRVTPASGVQLLTHVRWGEVTKSIVDLSDELEIDLVVMTTHGRGGFARAWLGSVADGLLRNSTKPLLVLRGKEDTFSESAYPKHVLVPLDGSERAEAALEMLPVLLPASGARISLAAVLQEPAYYPTAYPSHAVSTVQLWERQKARAESYMAEVSSRLDTQGVHEVQIHAIVSRSIATSLIDFAEREAVDFVVLSTHGRRGMSRFVIGSVADKLIRAAEVPVLVVPRREEA